MQHNIWSKRKPVLEEECLLITARKINSDYEYSLFEIMELDCEGEWYYGLVDQNGCEWGDYEDLAAERYLTMPKLTT